MKELRPHVSYPDFISLYEKAHSTDGYDIVAVEVGTEVVAVMGYRVLHDYVHGTHLYIDDLVSTESHRSKGWGTMLLAHAEEVARVAGCSGLRLCTGVENERGKMFYEKNGWIPRALAFKKKLG